MIKKTIHFCTRTVALTVIAAIITVVSAFVWVVSEPRSLSKLTPYIKDELNSITPSLQIQLDETFIKWDPIRKNLGIYVPDVTVTDDMGDVLAEFPEIYFDFSLIRFLRGGILSSDITLVHPRFYLNTGIKKLYAENPNSTSTSWKDIILTLSKKLKDGSVSLPIHSLQVQDADLFVTTKRSDMVLHFNNGYARAYESSGENNIKAEFELQYGKNTTQFNIDVGLSSNNDIDIAVQFKDFPSYAALDVYSEISMLNEINLIFDGKINILLNSDKKLPQLNFDFTKIDGSINHPKLPLEKLNLHNVTARGSIYEDFSVITIDNLHGKIDKSEINISGIFKKNYVDNKITPEANGKLKITNLSIGKTIGFISSYLDDDTKQLIHENIGDGHINNADFTIAFDKNDYLRFEQYINSPDKTGLPMPVQKNNIDANFDITDLSVKLPQNYPTFSKINTTIRFNGTELDADIKNGKFDDSDIYDSNVKIADIWQPLLVAQISGKMKGNNTDFIKFLKANHKSDTPSKSLQSVFNIEGKIDGEFSLDLPLQKPVLYNDLNLKIKSNLSNVKLPEMLNNKDITDGMLVMNLDGRKLNIKGNAKLNGIEINVDYNQNISSEIDLQYNIQAVTSVPDLKELGLFNTEFINNKFFLNADITDKDNKMTVNAKADVLNSEINIPLINFYKPTGTTGTIKFKAVFEKNKPVLINDFIADGDGFSAAGSGSFSSDVSELESLKFNKLQYAGNDFEINYNKTSDGYTLDINGKMMDLSDFKLKKLTKGSGKNKRSKVINVDVSEIIIGNGEHIKDMKLELNCTKESCRSMNLYGKLRDDGYLAGSLKPVGERSALLIESDNAGAVINALDISPNITGGRLDIQATSIDQGDNLIAEGIIKLENFTAAKTPILGKVLSLASLQGINDLLNKKGITFENFEAPFSMSDGIITITEAKTSGSSIGITADGTVDTNINEVNIKGVLVPAHAINNALGKIPLIGNLITGGKNEGVFATSYTIEGPYEDVKASVNPLSIFTPGILRKIFDFRKETKSKESNTTSPLAE